MADLIHSAIVFYNHYTPSGFCTKILFDKKIDSLQQIKILISLQIQGNLITTTHLCTLHYWNQLYEKNQFLFFSLIDNI